MSNPYAPIYGAIEDAADLLENYGDAESALNKLVATDGVISEQVGAIKQRIKTTKAAVRQGKPVSKPVVDRIRGDVGQHNALVAAGNKVRDAIATIQGQSAPGSMSRNAIASRIQSVPGPGRMLRIPLVSDGTNGTVTANNPHGLLVGATANERMVTIAAPYLRYEIQGLLIQRVSDAAGTTDSVTIEDLRVPGYTNLIMAEAQMGVESFRMGNSRLVGLRTKLIVVAPNVVELRVRAFSANNAAPLGNSVIIASLVIRVLWDALYGGVGGRESQGVGGPHRIGQRPDPRRRLLGR